MFSVVLMAAISSGAEAPDFGRCSGCCSGSYGCSGCYGGGCHARRGHGCRGGCHGGCYGGCYGGGCYGGCCSGSAGIIYGPGMGPGYGPGMGTGGGTIIERKKEMPKGTGPEEISAATIVVSLPADARLTVDGRPTTSTSDRRIFTTPALERDGQYIYTLRAEVTRDGRTVEETQDVVVRGGQVTNASFNLASTGGVASR